MSYGILFDGQTADDNSAPLEITRGEYQFSAWGTFGGGGMDLQWKAHATASGEGSTTEWITVSSGSMADNAAEIVKLGDGFVRAALSGSTGATLYARILPVDPR